jgi:hypothetical protein
MGAEVNNGNVLTTWKEVAAYLKCGVRTCIRWEAESGLPVHRQEGAPRSRIFAYKSELDAWLQSRLNNGALRLPEAVARTPFWKAHPFILALLVPALAAAVWLALGLIKKGSQSSASSGVPSSTGPGEITPGAIVEAEYAPEGRMRIWKKKDEHNFFESWRIEPVRHTSIAAGDLDGEPDIEIACPGHCRVFYEADGLTASKIGFFINAYKLGFRDWWKTTYFDRTQWIFEKDNFEFTETAIGDADGRPGNEVALVTAHHLSIIRYDTKAGELRLVSTQNPSPEGRVYLLRSVALTDIDADGRNEIVVSANEGEEGYEAPDKGWLLVFKWGENGPEIAETVALPGPTSVHSLRAGNVIPGGTKELAFPCYAQKGESRTAYVFGWAADRGFVFKEHIGEVSEPPEGDIRLDVGDLSREPGDEILVARHDPNELISLFWQGSRLRRGPKYELNQRVRVLSVHIGMPLAPKTYSSIVLSGSGQAEGQPGSFYLEWISYGDGFIPGWVRLGGDKEDLRVSYSIIVNGPN